MTTWTNTSKNTSTYSNIDKSVMSSAILLESGYKILLESGYAMLLESEGQATQWSNNSKNTSIYTNITKS